LTETRHFALVVLLCAAVGIVAVLSNRLTDRLRVPVPVLVLVAAAVAVRVVPPLHVPPVATVEDAATVALVCILFDGGMHIGLRRVRSALAPIAVVGVLGTFATALGAAVLLHLAFALSWYASLLVATAIAPTDPAVVFSVLGRREIVGRSGTILEGESGANDPVGIALMVSLLSAGGLSGAAVGQVAGQFVLQMAVGGAIGVVGGLLLRWFITAVALPSEGLYPVRTLACALLLYGVGTLAHGSGFLAVFIAAIVIGDERAPFKREIERFHSAVASLAEIVVFVVLGLTVDLDVLRRTEVWVPGLVVGVVVAFAVRPLLAGLCLLPARLRRNELAFVLFAGLKGAVPLLLGELMVAEHVAHAQRLYGIVVVAVVFSVLVQGTATPWVAALLRIPMRPVELTPYAFGVRLRDEPSGVFRHVVDAGSRADGAAVSELALPEDAWVSAVVRDGALVQVRGDTRLEHGDDVVVLGGDGVDELLRALFER